MRKKISVLKAFFKIGLIGFGGGSALIPVIEKEIVEENKWLTDEEYTKNTIIANITPGALPVKLGALWSVDFSIISAYSVAIPGVLFLILMLTGLSLIGENAIKYIEFASIGISTFIIMLLYMYIKKVMNASSNEGLSFQYITITVIAFLLTTGKEIRQIIAIMFKLDYKALGTPIFDISALNLMIITMFVILFIGNSKSILKLLASLIISVAFALSVGKMNVLPITNYLYILMSFMVICSIAFDIINKPTNIKIKFNYKIFKNILKFAIIAIIISALSILATKNTTSQTGVTVIDYISNVIVSTATSFGGGEAYVTVADGFFVQNGFVEAQVFYNQIVAIANALPGPILVKIASAIGYTFGFSIGGVGLGWLLACAGTAISVGVSSILALIVLVFFDMLKDSPRLKKMVVYVLPVVCGMLISTILSILYETLKILSHNIHLNTFIAILIVAIIFFAMLIMHKKYHINDIVILIIGGGITLGIFSIM